MEEGRKNLADWLKGLAVIFMVQVHLMELLATPDFYNSIWGKISLFMGGPPAAPVFMGIMGYFIASSGKPLRANLYRAMKLICWGLLLNIGINLNLFYHILTHSLDLNTLEYLFGVDILILAGLSVGIIALLKVVLRQDAWLWAGIISICLLVSQITFPEPDPSSPFNYIQALFVGNFSWSYFPLFPWLAYPLSGYLLFLILDKINWQIRFSKPRMILVGFLGIVVLSTIPWASGITHKLPQYYHHALLFYSWTIIFLSVYTLLIYKLLILKITTKAAIFLSWVGRNVTAFYVVQWLIIGNLATSFYKTLSPWPMLACLAGILLISSGLVYCWTLVKRSRSINIL